MRKVKLQGVGLSERDDRNSTIYNFSQLETVVNSNAGEADELVRNLSAKDQQLNDKINQSEEQLNDKISQSEERLTKRIAELEDMLFGQHPQVVKMAENSTSPVNGGAMLVNLTNEEDK